MDKLAFCVHSLIVQAASSRAVGMSAQARKNDMGREISEGIEGAVTGDRVNCVSHMLYADDLGLTSNDVGEMQTMLNKLCTYAEKKGLYSSYNCASFCFFCLARLVSGFFQTSAEMPFEAYIVM